MKILMTVFTILMYDPILYLCYYINIFIIIIYKMLTLALFYYHFILLDVLGVKLKSEKTYVFVAFFDLQLNFMFGRYIDSKLSK